MKDIRDFNVNDVDAAVEQIHSNLFPANSYEKENHPERVFERAKKHYIKYLKRRLALCECLDFEHFKIVAKKNRL